jgi:hypothetical protein
MRRENETIFVIASDSEAIQGDLRATLDCFVAELLAMTRGWRVDSFTLPWRGRVAPEGRGWGES